MTPHQAAHLTALSQPSSPAPVFGDLGSWAAWNFHTLAGEAVCDVGEWAMKRKHRREAGQFIPRKAARAVRAVLPSWALAVFTVCLCIPGPFDEIAAVLASLVLLVVRFPRARAAWKGGKSHRISTT